MLFPQQQIPGDFCHQGITEQEEQAVFRMGDEETKRMQTELRRELKKIKRGEEGYKRKLENELAQNIREVWSRMRTITGHGKGTDQVMEENFHHAKKLNLFLSRFYDANCAIVGQ